MLGMMVALQAAAAAPAATFAPPVGVVLRQSTEEVREDGRARRAFRIARDIVFASEPTGFRATVTLRDATADGSPLEKQNYRAANAPLLARPVVIHIDHAGKLRSIDDLAGVWAAWSGGLAATRSSGSTAEGDAIRARLAMLPPERIAAMIGSMVTELVVPAAERVPVVARPVSLASPPPFSTIMLNGTASATAEGDRLRVRLVATGEAPATSDRPAARIAVTAHRLVDTQSGLLRSATRSERVTAPGLSLTVTNTTTLDW